MAGIQSYTVRDISEQMNTGRKGRWAERGREDGCWTTWEVTEAHEETWTETQSCGRVAKRLFYFKAE